MKKIWVMRHTIFGVIILVCATALNTFAAGGDLDTTFTTGVTAFGNSSARVVVVQLDGRVLVGGSFTVVNGRAYSGLARLNADGTVDQGFNIGTGFTGAVNAIAVQPDGRIVAGGGFTFFNGVQRGNLVRLNADGSLDTTFNVGGTGFNTTVEAIVLQANGQILVGGSFAQYNGATVNRLARLNFDGSRDTAFTTNLGTGFNNTTNAIAVETDGQIVVGGSFTSVNGTTANEIARLNASGTLDTTFITNIGTGFNTNRTVNSLALQTDGRIVVGGNFTTFNGVAHPALVRLNDTGTFDTGFTLAVNPGIIEALQIQTDGRIIAAGQGSFFGAGNLRRHVARVNADGSLDLSFNAGTASNGTTLTSLALQPDGTIFVVGTFTAFNNIVRSSLVKLNADGSVNLAFAPVIGASATVNAILVQADNKILIGGDFSGVNESFREKIARLNADGTTDVTFNPGVGTGGFTVVLAIAVQMDGKIIVSGSPNDIVRLNSDGSPDATFNASSNGTVNAVAIQPDGRIIIGGLFTNVNGVNGINRSARLNTDGTTDATFNTGTGFSSNVNDLVLQANGQIVAVGLFTSYNGTTGVNRIARLNTNGTLDTAFTTNTGTGFNSTVNSLALQTDGRIVAGGSFATFNGTSSVDIARLNADGTRDTNFNVGTGFGGAPLDFALQPDGRILAVGNFPTYNGIPRFSLARLNVDGLLDASFRSGAPINTGLKAVGLQCDGRIIIGGALQSYDNIQRFGIARVLAGDTLTWTGAADTNWNNSANWSTGFAPTAIDIAVIPNGFTVNLSGGSFSVTTLTVGTGATLTIAAGSSLTIEGSTNNGTISGAGTLNFIGTAFTNNGTISASAVNVNLNMTCAGFNPNQTKFLIGTGAFVGNVLTIASGVTLSLQDNHQFNTINAPGALDATSRTVNLRGANPLQGAGSIITTFSTFIFDGTAAQTVSRSTSFHNLTINNAAGVTFGGSAAYSVAGIADLTNGILNLNSSSQLNCADTATAIRTNGYITGVVSKSFSVAGLPAFIFPLGTANGYSPVTVAITSGTTQITANVTQAVMPGIADPTRAINRYWTLVSSAAPGAAVANLTFQMIPGLDEGANFNLSAANVLRRNSNGSINELPAASRTANSVTVNNVNQFSEWTLANNAGPTGNSVAVSGRVMNLVGRGIAKAQVSLANLNGETQTTTTDKYGYYRFDEIPAGETYSISVRYGSTPFINNPRIIRVFDEVQEVDFMLQRGRF